MTIQKHRAEDRRESAALPLRQGGGVKVVEGRLREPSRARLEDYTFQEPVQAVAHAMLCTARSTKP